MVSQLVSFAVLEARDLSASHLLFQSWSTWMSGYKWFAVLYSPAVVLSPHWSNDSCRTVNDLGHAVSDPGTCSCRSPLPYLSEHFFSLCYVLVSESATLTGNCTTNIWMLAVLIVIRGILFLSYFSVHGWEICIHVCKQSLAHTQININIHIHIHIYVYIMPINIFYKL